MDDQGLIVLIGLGEIGRPLFNIIQRTYPGARGVDIEPVAIDAPVGIMHVCYPFTLDSDFVGTTVAYAKKYAPQLIVINSTVAPGTTREVQTQTGIPSVYSPVRGKHTRMEADLGHYHKFVGGTDAAAVLRAAQHFESIGLHVEKRDKPETVELGKLLETSYFGLLIAWAQEMDRFAKQYGVDYREMTDFFAEVDYLPQHVFVPGYIGGHCVIPNIALLKSRLHSTVLDAIVASNEQKGKELAADEVEKNKSKDRQRVEPIKLRD